jgi:hypothetical protein
MSGFPLCYNLIKKNQNPDSYRDKAAEYFGVLVFHLAHAIQLVVASSSSNSIAYLIPTQQASKQSLIPKMF